MKLYSGKYFIVVSLLLFVVLSKVATADAIWGYNKLDNWGRDLPRGFLPDDKLIYRLEDMERLRQGSTRIKPWPSTNWPDKLGLIAQPYRDPVFRNLIRSMSDPFDHFETIFEFLTQTESHIKSRFLDLTETERSILSPATKYDYLVGDADLTLTHQILAWFRIRKEKGHAAAWSGLCHAWVTLAQALPRPQVSVDALDPSGRPIIFYPSDIEALGILLWTNYSEAFYKKIHSVGRQCRRGFFARLFGSNAESDPKCRDVNPGMFHIALVSRLGQNHQSLVMDYSQDFVFNVPILSYRYSYFEPKTGSPTESLEKATSPFLSVLKIPASETSSVVGIETTLQYLDELPTASLRGYEHSTQEITRKLTLRYYLELDFKGEIIGGEWTEESLKIQPDLLWYARTGERAFSNEEPIVEPGRVPYDPRTDSVPTSWRALAKKGAKLAYPEEDVMLPYPQPLGAIIYPLWDASLLNQK